MRLKAKRLLEAIKTKMLLRWTIRQTRRVLQITKLLKTKEASFHHLNYKMPPAKLNNLSQLQAKLLGSFSKN
jgi:hypothetical protein